MKRYLLIESVGAFETSSATAFFALARDLAALNHRVEIFLVQNGVLSARAGAKAEGLDLARQAGIPVLADEFSLRERAISAGGLVRGVMPTTIGVVVDRMADGWNVVWH